MPIWYLREQAAEEARQRKQNLEIKALSWQRAQVIRDYIAAVGLAREEGRIEVEAAAFAAWRSWALAHAGSLDFIASGNPLVSLEEAPEKLVEPGAGAAERGYASAGSPGWFPGRKWYHR